MVRKIKKNPEYHQGRLNNDFEKTPIRYILEEGARHTKVVNLDDVIKIFSSQTYRSWKKHLPIAKGALPRPLKIATQEYQKSAKNILLIMVF